ncbi:MAG: NUDIX hydrolase [Bacteroidetes bacterium SW_11_45_7]|nr:MAG: NUDIX hydrolase [Bacteroidetes bacterium SW_11_45_7]
MQEDRRFNIRVYGLLIYNEQILLADEIIQGNEITKFPGGGLRWGEGPVDGLKREWQEETGLHIEVEQHFYTTEFFQLSAFDSRDQVISIYYRVEAADLRPLQMSTDEVADKDEEKDDTRKTDDLTKQRIAFPNESVNRPHLFKTTFLCFPSSIPFVPRNFLCVSLPRHLM